MNAFVYSKSSFYVSIAGTRSFGVIDTSHSENVLANGQTLTGVRTELVLGSDNSTHPTLSQDRSAEGPSRRVLSCNYFGYFDSPSEVMWLLPETLNVVFQDSGDITAKVSENHHMG
ncbi:hypothetical protein J6590_001509 [Homalodisca vitripennis]|nr:hypothetical protein J6590_001509 [Homalodisca vitripennis]